MSASDKQVRDAVVPNRRAMRNGPRMLQRWPEAAIILAGLATVAWIGALAWCVGVVLLDVF
jgi:hypothetical protein